MVQLICPNQWDGIGAIEFVNQLANAVHAEELCVDFRSVDFVKPFGTLIIANGLRRFVGERKANGLKTSAQLPKGDLGACSYLRHIGFFEYIGVTSGNRPGDAKGSKTYVPIRVVTLSDLQMASGGRAFQLGAEKLSDQLADVVYPRITEQIMMQYCLREIIRNVFEHGEIDSCTVFAQRYSSGWAEVAIIDEGIGIHTSLSRSIPLTTVDDALRMAIMPGISRVTKPQGTGEWENSGFGLYVLSELGNDLGEFMLASNGRYQCLSARPSGVTFGDLAVPGTAVKLLVDLEAADYFPNRLRQIVATGEQHHLKQHGTVKSASKRSKSTKTS
jgi:anti-sigma regulatory factor (Ser/Thr protein kinase)